jgi:hypothetical protein
VARVDGYPGEQLRTLAQDLQRRGRRVVVLVVRSRDKVSIAVATDDSLDAQQCQELAVSSAAVAAVRRDWPRRWPRPMGIDAVLSAAAAL